MKTFALHSFSRSPKLPLMSLLNNYIIAQVILAFWLVLAYDLFREDGFLDWRHHYKVFPSAVLKWRKDLRIRIIFYVTRQKDKVQKKFLPRYWTSSRSKKKKKIKPFLLDWWSRKKIRAVCLSQYSSETRTRTNLISVSREPLLYTNLTLNPINKMLLRGGRNRIGRRKKWPK